MKVKTKTKNKTKNFLSDLSKIDRRIVILLFLALAGSIFYSYTKIFGDKYEPMARKKADTYLQTIKDCDYAKNFEVKYGITYSSKSGNSESKTNFEKGCKELESYQFLKLVKVPTDSEEYRKAKAELSVGEGYIYLVDYRVNSTTKEVPYVTRLMAVWVDGTWSVFPAPGFPVTESQYNKSQP